ncbi:MAG: class I SAM-dependent RNA methyltransferase [Saprospiraceae bacterium]|nr:class I SAM-dependent RNA methyltransferase [Bacteroidia bacterium]NNE14274.1 class I SAM-dependent RNA methyltransferase [Saprospiraceae bacterium]NNL92971.1 class I SAM-dependent RNA methyltransferase [Saprospiraceae bacterium]
MEIVVKTLEGLEGVLANELKSLQLSNIEILNRAVRCEGTWSQLYKCNYCLRTAMRVLVPIKKATLESQDDLYDVVKSIDWTEYIPDKKTFAINGTIAGELFTYSRFAVFRAKDAIADQLVEKKGYRPNVKPKNPDILIDLYINADNELTISMDSSGKSLHLRNYKYRQYKAPLNEVLAAGIILLAGYDGSQVFQDAMCGSGTLITEALMIAANIPAGMFIEKFAFQNWANFSPEVWESVKEIAKNGIRHPENEIIGSDLNRFAIRDVKKNLQKFPLKEKVQLFERDFFKTNGHPNRLLIMNPPYDRRIAMDNIHEFYSEIGNALKKFWQDSTVWVITSNLNAMKSFGLRPTKKITLNNGGLESKLYKFEVYEGSRKAKFQRKD